MQNLTITLYLWYIFLYLLKYDNKVVIIKHEIIK